jgi:hypothetical protein
MGLSLEKAASIDRTNPFMRRWLGRVAAQRYSTRVDPARLHLANFQAKSAKSNLTDYNICHLKVNFVAILGLPCPSAK